MALTTDVLSLPFPEGSDDADGPSAFQALAERVEALLLGADDGLAGWTIGDFKDSARTTSHGRWLLCDQERELTQAEIESELSLSEGDAADFVTLLGTGADSQYGTAATGKVKIPGFRDVFPVPQSAAKPKKGTGSTGGAATVTLSAAQSGVRQHQHGDGTLAAAGHTHDDGTLSAASHSHDDGTLAAASHFHGDGTLAAASHQHDDGTLAAASHFHDDGTLGTASHSHGNGTLAAAGHTHPSGSLYGADHSHAGGGLITNYSGSLPNVMSTAGAADIYGIHAAGVAPSTGLNVTYAMKITGSTAGSGSIGIGGSTDSAAPSLTGAMGAAAPDVTGSTGSTGADVTGATGNAGADVTGATGSVGADVTGSTGSATADVTGATGSTGADVTGATGNQQSVDASAGSAADQAHENLPPYRTRGYVFVRV